MSRRENHWQYFVGCNPKDIIHHFNICYPPIDPFLIAQWLGIDVYQTNDSASERNEIKDRKASIYINTTRSPNVQRFRLASQIGSLLKQTDSILIKKAFALDLLVPSSFYLVTLRYYSITQLSDVFGVPQSVIDYRVEYG